MQKSRADVTEGAESIFSCPEKHGRVIVTAKRKECPLWNDRMSDDSLMMRVYRKLTMVWHCFQFLLHHPNERFQSIG